MKKFIFIMLALSVVLLFAACVKPAEYKLSKIYTETNGVQKVIEQSNPLYAANKAAYGETLKVSRNRVEFSGVTNKSFKGDYVKEKGKIAFTDANTHKVYKIESEGDFFRLIINLESSKYIHEYKKT